MKLKADSFVAKIAYNNPFSDAPTVPDRTSLCPLFWRFLFFLFIVWPLGWVAFVMLAALVYGGAFLFGYRPAHEGDRLGEKRPIFVPLNFFPRIVGWRITPALFLCLWAFYAIYRPLIRVLLRVMDGLFLWLDQSALLWVCFMAPIIIVGMVGWFLTNGGLRKTGQRIGRSSVYQLFAGRLRAFKEKACPIITFEKSELPGPTGGPD